MNSSARPWPTPYFSTLVLTTVLLTIKVQFSSSFEMHTNELIYGDNAFYLLSFCKHCRLMAKNSGAPTGFVDDYCRSQENLSYRRLYITSDSDRMLDAHVQLVISSFEFGYENTRPRRRVLLSLCFTARIHTVTMRSQESDNVSPGRVFPGFRFN